MINEKTHADKFNQLQMESCLIEQDLIKIMKQFDMVIHEYNTLTNYYNDRLDISIYTDCQSVAVGCMQWEENMIPALSALKFITHYIACPDIYTIERHNAIQNKDRELIRTVDKSTDLYRCSKDTDIRGEEND